MRLFIITIILSLAGTLMVSAQEENALNKSIEDKSFNSKIEEINDTVIIDPSKRMESIKPAVSSIQENDDALRLPMLNDLGQYPSYMSPWGYGGYYGLGGWGYPSWNLHEGLNVSLGMSVFSTFGSGNTWSGAGFSEKVALAYAVPLSKRLSLAIGGYLANTSWAHDTYRTAGITGLLNYRITDKLDGYIYGQKSIIENRMIPLPIYDMNDMGDKIGIGFDYHFTPSFSIGVNFEQHFNNNSPFNYGIPKTKIDKSKL